MIKSTVILHGKRKRSIVKHNDKSAQFVISSAEIPGNNIQVYTGTKKILTAENSKYCELLVW